MVKQLSGLHAKIVTTIGSIASMIAHSASHADASPFTIDPESIDTLEGVRPYMQAFQHASNSRLFIGSNSLLVTWQGSNLLLMQRGPHERAPWE